MTTAPSNLGPCDPRNRLKGKSVPLPVLTEPANRAPHSTMGRWRAAVLILIHLAIVAHIVQWWLSGMSDGQRETLSPVEPSESMFTLETGRVNAGFVMFAAAILATVLLGRFFCGWACHIVAVQDLCGWIMKKCGIHPKPWRSRLLLWVPLLLALYMFVWPTFRREVLHRWLGDSMPDWLGQVYPLRGFQNHFIVENFWATFAPWYVAIPFLGVCGFATVYFMGAKAFCSYGCPYGGFFTPVDRLSPARIRVTDDCHQCGHCTAVCTSNVRVHEEVRDYGAVIDPGCMKTMDCVNACPNKALYWGFGAPAVLTRPRPGAKVADANEKRRLRYDLTWKEEVAIGIAFYLFFFGFRGMYFNFFNLDFAIPMLMAVAMAGVASFALYKCWRLLRDDNVRGPYWQLKKSGRVRPAGWLFVAGSAAWIGLGLQGAVMGYGELRGGILYGRLSSQARLDQEVVYAPGYKPSPEDQAAARRAIELLRLAGPMNDGGVGFYRRWITRAKLTYLYAVAGDLPAAERELIKAVNQVPDSEELVGGIPMLGLAQGKPAADVEATLSVLARAHPNSEPLRRSLAQFMVARGRGQEAVDLYDRALKQTPKEIPVILTAAQLNLELGRGPRAIEILEGGLKVRPKSPPLNGMLAQVYLTVGRLDDALRQAQKSVDIESGFDQLLILALVQEQKRDLPAMLATLGRAAALSDLTASQLETLAQVFESAGDAAAAKAARDRGAKLAPGPKGTPNSPQPNAGN